MNKASKKYCKDIKLFLPLYGEEEKNLLNSIAIRLSELNDTNIHITYDEICDKLGTPQEIVSEYITNMETDYISKKLRFAQYIKNAIIVFIIILLILSGIRINYLNKAFKELKNDIVTYEQEVIE